MILSSDTNANVDNMKFKLSNVDYIDFANDPVIS